MTCMCSHETKPDLKLFLGVACRDLWTSSVGVLAPEECLDLFRNLPSIYRAIASLFLEYDPLSTGFAAVLSGFSVCLASFLDGLDPDF